MMADPHAPQCRYRTFDVHERSFPDQRTRDFYEVNGFRRFVQVNHQRCLVDDRFDMERFDAAMYSPERTAAAMLNPNWGYPKLDAWAGHMSGPPPGFAGMIQVDLERPHWNKWRAQDFGFDVDAASVGAAVVGQLVVEIARRWPNALLTSYNYINAITAHGVMVNSDRFERMIGRWFAGNCPSLYAREEWNTATLIDHALNAVRRSLAYKIERPDFLVLPEIWKLYRTGAIGEREVRPIDEARAQLTAILDLRDPHGHRIDGLVIFDTSEHQEANLPFASMIMEELDARELFTR